MDSNSHFALCAFPSYKTDNTRAIKKFQAKSQEGPLEDPHGSVFDVEPFDAQETSFLSEQSETSMTEHLNAIEAAIESIRKGNFRKVVLSKVKKVFVTQQGVDIVQQAQGVFEKLVELYPTAFVYLYVSPKHGIWLGATPEFLLIKKENKYESMSLAGTQPYRQGLDSQNIIWSDKEKEEQQIVTDYITDKLLPHTDGLMEISGPYMLRAGNVAHRSSYIQIKSNSTLKELTSILHPTPAVCGTPRDAAFEFVGQTEKHRRRLYTGYIGVVEPNGDAKLYVNLRCMQRFEDYYLLYLGGGITALSDPQKEWEETELKAKTMMAVLE
jgi:isochorismate synthase